MGKKIAVFTTSYETLHAENIFIKNSLQVKPIVKPRAISSECGMALEFNISQEKELLQICRENNLDLVGLFESRQNGIF